MKLNWRILLAAAAFVCAPCLAHAQSSPGLYYGQVPTAAQWNQFFSAKQDFLNYTPLNKAGDTMLGPLGTVASGAGGAGFNIPPGVAPTSPNPGNMWMTSAGLFYHIGSTTIGPLAGTNAGSFAATFPLSVTFPSGIATYAINYNSTLTVDGSNKLGINLGNTNTWAAAQTFPNASITNAELANPSTTVNGVPCVLGSTCAVTATPIFINAANPVVAGTSYTPILPDGTDQTAHLTALLSALQAAGIGATIEFPLGTYLFNSCIALPNTGASTPTQVTMVWQGAGDQRQGNSGASEPSTGTIFDLRCTDTYGRIKTFGRGLFRIRGISFANLGNSTGTPIIYDTNTNLDVQEDAFYGASDRTTSNFNEDAIVFGGTTDTPGPGPTAPFQGYISNVSNNYFSGVRRLVLGQTFFNANIISGNYVSGFAGCGTLTGCGAIEINGNPGGTGEFAVGNKITDNGIEMTGYAHAIKLRYAEQTQVLSNDCYDPGAPTQDCVYLDTNAIQTVVLSSLQPGALPYLGDPNGYMAAGNGLYLSADPSKPSIFPSIIAGTGATPNNFGNTVFTGNGLNGSQTVIQPTSVPANDNSEMLIGKRSASDPTNPGTEFLHVLYGGGIALTGTNAGNITINNTSGGGYATWTNFGRSWTSPGTGGAMSEYSGTGGSFLTLANFAVKFLHLDNSTQGAEVGPVFGGNGYDGIGFGTTNQGQVYYNSAAGGMQVNLPFGTHGYTVSTLPTCNANSKGFRDYVTDATSPSFLGTLTGSGTVVSPVFCNGSAWVAG